MGLLLYKFVLCMWIKLSTFIIYQIHRRGIVHDTDDIFVRGYLLIRRIIYLTPKNTNFNQCLKWCSKISETIWNTKYFILQRDVNDVFPKYLFFCPSRIKPCQRDVNDVFPKYLLFCPSRSNSTSKIRLDVLVAPDRLTKACTWMGKEIVILKIRRYCYELIKKFNLNTTWHVHLAINCEHRVMLSFLFCTIVECNLFSRQRLQ